MPYGFRIPAFFFGMAVQAATTGLLTEMGMLRPSAGQQLMASMIFLFIALMVSIVILLTKRK